MLPSPRSLAAFGLRAALNDIVAAEDRAHAFIDSYEAPPRDREAVAAMLRALDRIDVGAHELTLALRRLDEDQAAAPVVTMTERRPATPAGEVRLRS